MQKFSVRISNDYKKLYTSIIEAETEKEAILLTVEEAESKGIHIPDEFWTRIKIVK